MRLFPAFIAAVRHQATCVLFLCLILSSRTTLVAQHSLQNDEFNQASTLSQWYNLNTTEGWNAEQLEQININTSTSGHLMMMPYTSVWYNNKRGPFLYKNIDGNFVFTVQVRVSNRAGTGFPSVPFSLGGCMIRAPKTLTTGSTGWVPGQEDYVFLSLGYADPGQCGNCPAPHFEVKSTTNSVSSLSISPIAAQTVTIRLVRIDSTILVLYQLPGQAFVLHRRYNRPDLPAITQVGMVSYTDWTKASTYTDVFHNSHVLNAALSPNPSPSSTPFRPDIRAHFNFARFDEVNRPTNLVGRNLANPTQASNAELLAWLGYNSVAANYAQLAGRYISVWEPGNASQYLLLGQTWTAFTGKWSQLINRRCRLLNLEQHYFNGQWQYSGVFQSGTGKYGLYRMEGWASVTNRVNVEKGNGQKLIDIELLQSADAQYYLGVWRGGTENQLLDRALTWDQLNSRASELLNQGYRLIDVEVDLSEPQPRFFCLWETGTGTQSIYRSSNWNLFIQRNQTENAAGRQLIDIETYETGGQRWYQGTWREGASTKMIALHSSWEDFQAIWQTQSKQGYQMVEMERY